MPLHLVSRRKYDTQEGGVAAVQLLLARSADVDAQDECRITPLHLACYYGRLEIARVLLNHGARANTVNKLGQTPLHIVLEGNRSDGDGVGIVRLLVEHGANVNSQEDYNDTPLHLASNYGKLAIGLELLSHGANPSAKNIWGQTPLHVLSRRPWRFENMVPFAGMLVDAGADVNVRDRNHETPLHIAYRNYRLDIAQCLLKWGADTVAKNNRGEMPFQLAPRVMAT